MSQLRHVNQVAGLVLLIDNDQPHVGEATDCSESLTVRLMAPSVRSLGRSAAGQCDTRFVADTTTPRVLAAPVKLASGSP